MLDVGENLLRYNVGVRYVLTDQTIGGRVTFPDNRNITATTPTPTPTAPCYTSATNGTSADGALLSRTVVNFATTRHRLRQLAAVAEPCPECGGERRSRGFHCRRP